MIVVSLEDKVKVDPLNYKLFKRLYESKMSAQRDIHNVPPQAKKYFRVLVSKYEKIMHELFKKPGLYDDYFDKYSRETKRIG